jgi:hypothetical protein
MGELLGRQHRAIIGLVVHRPNSSKAVRTGPANPRERSVSR